MNLQAQQREPAIDIDLDAELKVLHGHCSLTVNLPISSSVLHIPSFCMFGGSNVSHTCSPFVQALRNKIDLDSYVNKPVPRTEHD